MNLKKFLWDCPNTKYKLNEKAEAIILSQLCDT